MRGERYALRAGEYLVWMACRRLPAGIRQERYQEWLAELPVILRDRDTGPAPVRVVRMLAFAADTLRGTALAPQAYRGAHRGAGARNTAAKSIRWLGTGLLLAGGLLGGLLVLLAYEGCIIYQLATGPNLLFSVPLVLVNLGVFRRQLHPAVGQPLAALVQHEQGRGGSGPVHPGDRQPVRLGSPGAVRDHQLLRLRDLGRLPRRGRGPRRQIPLPAPAPRPGTGAAAWPGHELRATRQTPGRPGMVSCCRPEQSRSWPRVAGHEDPSPE